MLIGIPFSASVTLDWDSLSLYQSGRDTRMINLLYEIHYLRWTGIKAVDRVVGMLGLLLILLAAISGARLAFSPLVREEKGPFSA